MRLAVTASLASIVLWYPSPAYAQPDLVFQGVHVVPMDTDRILSDRSVVVRDGRIALIAPRDAVAPGANATVVDGTGLYLMPGLTDMHVHVNGVQPDLTLYLANGVTTVRPMAGSHFDLRFREEIARGERLGPTFYTAGAIVDGDPPIWPGSTVVTDPAAADSVVREQKEAGYDYVKVYERLSADVYDAILQAARRHDIPVVGHVPASIDLEHAVAAGQLTIEHLEGFRRLIRPDRPPLPVARDSLPGGENSRRIAEITERMAAGEFAPEDFVDPVRLRRLAEMQRDRGVWNVPTLTVLRARWKTAAEQEAFLAQSAMAYVNPMVAGVWRNAAAGRTAMTDSAIVAARVWFAEEDMYLRALRDAGAGILLGTDTPNPNVLPGYAIHEELAHLVGAGLTPFEALAAGTRDAAIFFGAADEFGTVVEGRRADLVLVEGNPLADVANAARIRGVMVRGRWLSREELDRMLEAVIAEYDRFR